MTETRDGLLVPPDDLTGIDTAKHAKAFEGGARWFYWIAALSLINSVAHFARSQFSFVVGLGISQFIDGCALAAAEKIPQVSGVFRIGALALNAVVAGGFALLGRFALKREAWPFVLGMVLYVLDGLLFLLVRDWLSLGFHVFVLVGIYNGYVGLMRLRQSRAMTGGTPESVRAGSQSIEPRLADAASQPVAVQDVRQTTAWQRYDRLRRATWMISLCIGLPLPLVFLILIPAGIISKGVFPAIPDLTYILIALCVVLAFGAMLFGIPWLVFFAVTRSLRATLRSDRQAGQCDVQSQ
jgi:hypothetical protein